MHHRVKVDPTTGGRYLATSLRGRSLLINSFTNKGTAFTDEERTELGLDGLLPRAVCTLQQQLDRCYEHFSAKSTPLDKFVYLAALHDRNETLFYRLLHEHVEEMMPIVYTPTVGEACQEFSHIYRRARGVYLGIDGKGRIGQALVNHHADPPSVIVVTDGERILGLGDQGAGGMGIPIGKLCLYTLCAGVSPYSTLPVLLDAGTDNAERLNDPLYLGLRRRRVRGEEYQAFVDEFIDAVSSIWPHALVQFEDFLKGNAIAQLERFRDRICCFNDDIQGTAAVTLAGIYGALRLTEDRLLGQRIVIAGAGASAKGIADLLVAGMVDEGATEEEANAKLWLVDSQGLVHEARTGLEEFKRRHARSREDVARIACRDPSRISLLEVVAGVAPTVLIGTSAVPGLFTEEIVRTMASAVDQPIVLPLSNPTSKCECAPADVLRWTEGRAIVATGSPFAPVEYDGRTRRFGQCNNAFVFPGVGLGASAGRLRRITDAMFLDAARALAGCVQDEDLQAGSVFPSLRRIRDVSHAVAVAVIRRGLEEGLAEAENLDDVDGAVSDATWFPAYVPVRYEP